MKYYIEYNIKGDVYDIYDLSQVVIKGQTAPLVASINSDDMDEWLDRMLRMK